MLKYAKHSISFKTKNFEYDIIYSYYINGTGFTFYIETTNQDWYKYYEDLNDKPNFCIIEKDESYILKPIKDKFFDYDITSANLKIQKIGISKCDDYDMCDSGVFQEHINILKDGQIIISNEIRYIDIREIREKKLNRIKNYLTIS